MNNDGNNQTSNEELPDHYTHDDREPCATECMDDMDYDEGDATTMGMNPEDNEDDSEG